MTETESAGTSDDQGEGHGPLGIPCLWFFLPLPHPLGLPAGWTSELSLSPPELLRLSTPTSGLASSLLIHQVEPSTQPLLRDMADLWLFAATTMKNEAPTESGAEALDRFATETGGDLSALQVVRTVAEVAFPGASSGSEEGVLAALDAAIEHVRFVQRSVALATQHGVVLMSRATLPPAVPTFRGVAYMTAGDDHPKLPELQEYVEYFVPDCAPPSALGLRPKRFGAETLARIASAADRVSRRAAYDVYADLRREAMTQRHFGGNSRMAVVALAAAGEVLLDTTLMHMLWEEHTPPAVAAAFFDRNEGHTTRVARNFPRRLGGGWDPNARTPAGNYLRDLVRLRHRVIHAGHEPTADELEAAWKALFAFEHYLGDRLAAGRNLNRYPRTAFAWMADTGLKKRSRWTRHVRELTVDPSEPNWVDTFARWTHHVDRVVAGAAQDPGSNGDLMLFADLEDDGSIRWIIYDGATAHAAIVDAQQVRTADEIRSVARVLRSRHGTELADRRIGSLLDAPVPASLVWLPDHEVFPEFKIYPGTRTQPPA